MTSLLDQTLLSTNREYLFFKMNETDDESTNNRFVEPNYIPSFSSGRVTANTRISNILPAMYKDEYGVERINDFKTTTTTADGTSTTVFDYQKASRQYLDGMLTSELNQLFSMMREIDLLVASSDDVDPVLIQTKMNELYNKVKRGTDMIDFGNEIANEMSMEQERQLFERHKSKLVTLMNKNRNINKKLDKNRLYMYILLFVLIMYAAFMSLLYLHGDNLINIRQLSELVNPDSVYIIMLVVSIVVLFVYVIVDVYYLFTKREYETFFTEDTDTPVTAEVLVYHVNEYVHKLPMLVDLRRELKENITDKRAEVVKSILNDFNNLNYINMRKYQLADYNVNLTKHVINSSVKYGFLLVSVVAILGGLRLRTDILGSRNSATALVVSKPLFTLTTVLAVLFYVLVIASQHRQNLIRRKYNWDKMYFNMRPNANYSSTN